VVTTKGRSGAGRPTARAHAGGPGAREGLTGLLGDHAADLWAIFLVAVGVLLGLALYGAAAGAVGHGVDRGLGYVVGWIRYLLPPAGVAAGIVIIVVRPRPPALGVAVGPVLALLAVCGLADLAGGSPTGRHPSATIDAGGMLGVAAGRPLQIGLGTAGATVVLVALLGAATVVTTGVSVRTVARALAAAGAGTGRAVAGWWRSMVTGASGTARGEAEPPTDVEEDADDEGGAEEWAEEDEEEEDDAAEAGRIGAGGSGSPTAGRGQGEEHEGGHDGPGEADDHDLGARAGIGAIAAAPAPAAMGPAVGEWRLPPLGLLKRSRQQRHDERQVTVAGQALVDALAAHGVETRLVGWTIGPTVTRFELELGPGVKVARVTSLSKDIAYAMASPDVRILAPIPGKSAIGVEVPNRHRQLVSLGDVLVSDEARAATHPLDVALGRDIAGRPVMVGLAQMPHVLISGATGAGKSSCINSLVTSVLMRSTPDQVRMILVDPKRVELGQYNGLPHLLTPVVVDPKKAANALAWAVKEMERRYDLLAEYGVRDITGFNEAYDRGDLGPRGGPSVRRQVAEVAARAKARARAEAVALAREPVDADDAGEYPDAQRADAAARTADQRTDEAARTDDQRTDEAARTDDQDAGSAEAAGDEEVAVEDEDRTPDRLPFVLVVVDELNDLMMVAARDVEDSVVRIAQMARAVGIHLVLATQRPSVDVITGVIKANVPSRMAFSVSSLADSRVILDQPGAERLIGMGDMLLLTASSNIARRIQGPWVSEEEVRSVVGFWRRQGGSTETLVGIDLADEPGGRASTGGDDDDELLARAMEEVVRSQLGSTSMLQRKLRIGFARAGRLMDLLEQRGVVGPSIGSKARAVLMTVEELDRRP
jgi:DNA segregation ATPase FtsK/SpoIIIE-like protein